MPSFIPDKVSISSTIPNKGLGVGLRGAYMHLFQQHPPKSVGWVEIISENFMRWQNGLLPTLHMNNLETVRRNLPIAMHGVSLNIGSADLLDFDYLKRLKELVDRIEPFQISDHICWTGVDGQNFHDLLPVPYTMESLRLITTKVLQIQDFLGRPLLLENPSTYLEFSCNEMSEIDFINELIAKTSCLLLLDINNVYVNSVNHGFDARTYLHALPHKNVAQLHLAGHAIKDGYLIDTHDQSICSEVWRLLKDYVDNFDAPNVMIERDDNFPEWQELESEINIAANILQKKQSNEMTINRVAQAPLSTSMEGKPHEFGNASTPI